MAKKANEKISISFMDEALKDREAANTTVERWNGTDIAIKRTIGMVDVIAFVDNVTECCFMEDGSYHPELKEFLFRCNVLTRYANFALPEDLEHKFALVYDTDAYDFVTAHVDERQLNMLDAAIYEKLAYLCDSNTAGFERKMQDAVHAFEELQEKLMDLFSGIDHDDMTKLASAVANGQFSEERLVQAYAAEMKKDAQHESSK